MNLSSTVIVNALKAAAVVMMVLTANVVLPPPLLLMMVLMLVPATFFSGHKYIQIRIRTKTETFLININHMKQLLPRSPDATPECLLSPPQSVRDVAPGWDWVSSVLLFCGSTTTTRYT